MITPFGVLGYYRGKSGLCIAGGQGSCIYSKKEEEPRTHTDQHGLVV
jgi:hypothetical protein